MTDDTFIDPRDITIVIVDDDPVNLNLLLEVLLDEGYEVIPFSNPENALHQICWYPPNVVITDLHMPRLSGIELLEEMNIRLADLAPPCLVLSSSEDQGEVSQCFELGVGDFVSKPWLPGVLLAKLKRILGQTKAPRHKTPTIEGQIGDYRVLCELGRGGMGIVYKVSHIATGEVRALKVLQMLEDTEDGLLRFRREIDILGGLEHPNLIRMYEAGRVASVHFYVMDFVDGRALDRVTDEDGALDPLEVADILLQLGEALDFLHHKGLVHRDLKSANILLDAERRPILLDFGLAKLLVDSNLTAASQIVGTPQFMAPELIKGEPVDGRSDLFSLGLVALELLLGREVLRESNPYACMSRICEGRFPHASEIAGVPLELSVIVDALVELDPKKRFQSGAELCEAIRAFRLTSPS